MSIKVLRLWAVDMRQNWRDPMSLASILTPLAVAAVVRFLIPLLAYYLEPFFALMDYYPAIVGIVIMFPAMLSGMLGGFLMLDERDEGTLYAIQVTPLSGHQYTVYRILSPIVMGVVMAIIMVPLLGSTGVPLGILLLAATLSGLSGPLWAYAMFSLAENKIEGLAIIKFLGLLMGIPLLALFVPANFTPLFWILPFYWPFQMVVSAAGGAKLLSLIGLFVAGIGVSALYLTALTFFAHKRQA